MAVARYYSSIAQDTTLTAGVNSSATTLPVAATTGFPTNYPYSLVLDDGTASEELVSVTGASGLNLTVTRGYNGTTATSHALAGTVKHCFVGQDMTDFRTHEAASLSVHGLGASEAVVGTSTTQTLTNKTMDGGSNTFTNIPSSALAAIPESGVTNLTTDLAAKVAKSTVTAKGDLLAATGSAAVARVGVGTDGQYLEADSASAAGVKWVTPSSGGISGYATATADVSLATAGTEYTCVTLTNVTVGAGNHLVTASADFNNTSNTSEKVLIRLYRGTSLLKEATYQMPAASGYERPVQVTVVDAPGAGTYTYTLRAQSDQSGLNNMKASATNPATLVVL